MSSFKGRQQANREIIKLITSLVETYPDLRFWQILHNLSIVEREVVQSLSIPGDQGIVVKDGVHEESTVTLARAYAALIRVEDDKL